MRLMREELYEDIAKEKDLLTFLEKYFNSDSPGTIDKKGNSVYSGARRSVSDLYNLFKNYNQESNITYDNIIILMPLIKFINEKKDGVITIRYCSDAGKVVFFPAKVGYAWFKYFKEYNVSIGIAKEDMDRDGSDGINLNYILKILKQNYTQWKKN